MHTYLENRQLSDALNGYKAFLAPMLKPLETEIIPVSAASGRITACAVHAKISSPHFNACAMDGIAVRAADTFNASELSPVMLNQEQYRVVDTGDPVPESFDAVIMIEDIIFHGDCAELRAAACAWQHVRQIGEDICQGDMILPSYTKLTPSAVGALLAGGIIQVEIFKRVRVGIIPTGDELIPIGQSPKSGDIIEFNSHMLRASLIEAGCEVAIYDITRDSLEALNNALLRGVAENDAALLIAGSSAGRDDYTNSVISKNGAVFCHGIAIRPGKPAVLGVCGNKPVIGIPGYPVSAAIVLEQIVLPVISLLTKNPPPAAHIVNAVISRKIVSGLKYMEFLRVKLGYIRDRLVAIPMARGAGAIASLAKADGVAVIPCDSEGLDSGDEVEVELLRPLDEILNSVTVVGSHDPMLDIIGDIMRRKSDYYLSSAHVGSMGGIMALLRDEAHIAPIHLLDLATGVYNTTYEEKHFPGKETTLVKGVKRTQGIMVQKGNPKGIMSVSDLKNVTYINRQKGSGTRILLDFLLKQNGISADDIDGYQNEEYTHTAVAAKIAAGNAGAGLGIYAAAKMFDLDFIPVADEEYDFLIKTETLDNPMVQTFIETLRSEELKTELEKMGGYELYER